MATSSKTEISETEIFLWISYCVFEIYVKFGVFGKKNQSETLSITEIINCETGSCLNVQKGIFHETLRKTTW